MVEYNVFSLGAKTAHDVVNPSIIIVCRTDGDGGCILETNGPMVVEIACNFRIREQDLSERTYRRVANAGLGSNTLRKGMGLWVSRGSHVSKQGHWLLSGRDEEGQRRGVESDEKDHLLLEERRGGLEDIPHQNQRVDETSSKISKLPLLADIAADKMWKATDGTLAAVHAVFRGETEAQEVPCPLWR